MRCGSLLSVLVCVTALLGCDEKKKEEELLAKTGIEAGTATPTPSVTGVNVIPPAASSAMAVTAKPPKDCGTGDPTIDDPSFEAEIRLKTNKPEGTLTAADLAGVKSVNLTKNAQALDALDPCVFPKLTGLKFLYLPKGDYNDLSPIANLVHIEGLRVAHSQVQDLKPLAKLTVLDQLDLGVTPVRDLTPLANNVNITELSLDDTQVSDISVLAKLTKLEKLSIKNTLVTDVSPLAKLTHLKLLNVAGTALTNVDTLAPLRARGMVLNTK